MATATERHAPTEQSIHRFGESTAPAPRQKDTEALEKTAIAELSPVQIDRMPRDEMVRVIRAARMPLLRPDVDEHLEDYNQETLQRLVYLARRSCRHQGY